MEREITARCDKYIKRETEIECGDTEVESYAAEHKQTVAIVVSDIY